MILKAGLSILVFVISYAGIRWFIYWSLKRSILDIPNERSSHSRPVPVGAGIVISFSVLFALGFFLLVTSSDVSPYLADLLAVYFIASVALIIVSWLDDVKAVPAFFRFVVHATVAASLIWFASSWTEWFGEYAVAAMILSFIWITGLTNAYNFMDGIDGIAGIQAVTAGFGWSVVGLVAGSEIVAVLGFTIMAANVAFLIFNWQPAKVFMGDSGSAFLGFTFSVLPIFVMAGTGLNVLGSGWLLGLFAVGLVLPFVFDSSITFFRRLLGGERVWEPHRKHLYQKMVIEGMSHSRVSSIYGAGGGLCAIAVIVSLVFGLGASLVIPLFTLVALALWFLSSRAGEVRTESETRTN